MERWFVKNGEPYTHISMNGGSSLCVPNEELEEFYKEYINQVKTHKLYLVEKRTRLFRFFMDIDFISDSKLSHEEIVTIGKRIHSIIGSEKCFICISKSSKYKDKIKSGIHIHFPDLIVTSKKAQELRKSLPEDIIEFVDESVYKGSGLRMLWSYKRGDVDPYVPFYDIADDMYIEDKAPSVKYIKLLSIQTQFDTFSQDEQETHGGEIEEFIRQNFKNQDNLCIKKMKNEEKRIVIQTNSRYCEKRQGEHKSNHVYFVIDKTRRTIFQKCFDDECKNFESRQRRLSPSLKI